MLNTSSNVQLDRTQPLSKKSFVDLQVPRSKMSGPTGTGADTSRTDLEVVNPSMHIAEKEDCECKTDDFKVR